MIEVGIVIEDHKSVVRMEEFLNSTEDVRVLFCVASLPSLQKAIVMKGEPDVLLLQDGLLNLDEYAETVRGRKRMRTLMFAEEGIPDLPILSGWGMSGCFIKTQSLEELKMAIRYVYDYQGYISPLLAAQVLRMISLNPHERYADILTKREVEIIKLVCDGLTYKQIAEKMFITSFTVNQHLKKVYSKMNVHSKGELISKILMDKQV